MASFNERSPELSQKSQWEHGQKSAESELEPDLDVIAKIMKGVITERREVGEMKLIKIVADEGGDLFHNGIRISAKTVLVMVDGKSEPELLAGEYAHIINDSTLKVMLNCVSSPEQFRKFSNELYNAHENIREIRDGSQGGQKKIVETQKIQEPLKPKEDPKTEVALETRERLERF